MQPPRLYRRPKPSERCPRQAAELESAALETASSDAKEAEEVRQMVAEGPPSARRAAAPAGDSLPTGAAAPAAAAASASETSHGSGGREWGGVASGTAQLQRASSMPVISPTKGSGKGVSCEQGAVGGDRAAGAPRYRKTTFSR